MEWLVVLVVATIGFMLLVSLLDDTKDDRPDRLIKDQQPDRTGWEGAGEDLTEDDEDYK